MSEDGIELHELDAEIAGKATQKSNLLLSAQLLRAQRREDEAAVQFAAAALLEEELSEAYWTKGLAEKSWLHRFSAVGCWAQAGNFYRAIALCDEIQYQPDVPERLRQRVHDYAVTLRTRRAQWYEELALV
jgi:hypothetical protein